MVPVVHDIIQAQALVWVSASYALYVLGRGARFGYDPGSCVSLGQLFTCPLRVIATSADRKL